jgi:sulfide:quinone oxidoreductase
MVNERPTPRRVLIVGGGLTALEAMLVLRRLAGDRVAVQLAAPQRDFVYRPLPIAEPFGIGRVHRFDLATLTAKAGVELVPEQVIGVEPEDHRVATDEGRALSHDALLIASEAHPRPALRGAVTLWGVADALEVSKLLADLERGSAHRVAFAVHAGVSWPLPIYELALLTDAHLRRAGAESRRLVVVTHETEPLEMLGGIASASVRKLLEARGIELLAGRHPTAAREGTLDAVPGAPIDADRVVTLPRLDGPQLAGLPGDERGFIPVDALGRVSGIGDVYAAGEVTTLPVRQGDLATEQAAVVATAIVAAATSAEPEPFRPILRGLLRTGATDAPLGAEVGNGSTPGKETLWWPPDRTAGPHLASHLTEIAGEDLQPQRPALSTAATAVEVELSAG